jgi:hypothetical protein
MAKKAHKPPYVSPLPEEELSWRMGSSAGRKLEERLRSQNWSGRREDVAEEAH